MCERFIMYFGHDFTLHYNVVQWVNKHVGRRADTLTNSYYKRPLSANLILFIHLTAAFVEYIRFRRRRQQTTQQ